MRMGSRCSGRHAEGTLNKGALGYSTAKRTCEVSPLHWMWGGAGVYRNGVLCGCGVVYRMRKNFGSRTARVCGCEKEAKLS